LVGLLVSLALPVKHIWSIYQTGGVGYAHTNNQAKASKEQQKRRDHSIRTEGNLGTGMHAILDKHMTCSLTHLNVTKRYFPNLEQKCS